MIRLLVQEPLKVDQTIRASKEHRHYLEKVMRLKNTEILLFNGKDGEFRAAYAAGEFCVIAQTRVFEPLSPKALAFGLIKSHRLSWMMEKACELGVTELFPLTTQHVQSSVFNKDRYQRILIEAAEQSGRIDLPILHNVQSYDVFVHNLPALYTWHVASLSCRIPLMCRTTYSGYIIGPEGGLSEQEERTLIDQGVLPFSMGSLTLRAETAALWCLSH